MPTMAQIGFRFTINPKKYNVMKTLITTLAVTLFVLCSCSKDDADVIINNDPIIGIWGMADKPSKTAKNIKVKNEWIFNDANLGRYHQYHNEEIVIISDFRWSSEEEVYSISYPGLENRTDESVMLVEEQLVLIDGKVLAERE